MLSFTILTNLSPSYLLMKTICFLHSTLGPAWNGRGTVSESSGQFLLWAAFIEQLRQKKDRKRCNCQAANKNLPRCLKIIWEYCLVSMGMTNRKIRDMLTISAYVECAESQIHWCWVWITAYSTLTASGSELVPDVLITSLRPSTRFAPLRETCREQYAKTSQGKKGCLDPRDAGFPRLEREERGWQPGGTWAEMRWFLARPAMCPGKLYWGFGFGKA